MFLLSNRLWNLQSFSLAVASLPPKTTPAAVPVVPVAVPAAPVAVPAAPETKGTLHSFYCCFKFSIFILSSNNLNPQ